MMGWRCLPLVEYWLATAGLDFALKVVETGYQWVPRDCSPIWLYVDASTSCERDVLLRLRMEAAARGSEPVPLPEETSLDWVCAYVFIYPQLFKEAECYARRCLEGPRLPNEGYLEGALRDVELFRRVRERSESYVRQGVPLSRFPWRASSETVVANLGSKAVPLLRGWDLELLDCFSSYEATLRVVQTLPQGRGKRGGGGSYSEDPGFPGAVATVLRRRPADAIRALVEVISENPEGKDKEIRLLESLSRSHPEMAKNFVATEGDGDVIRRALLEEELPEATLEETPPVLREPPSLPKKGLSLPGFWSGIVRPLLKGRSTRLSRQATENLVLRLAVTPLPPIPVGLIELAETMDSRSLVEFVWHLFDNWLFEGAEPKQKWAFQALAHFYTEESVARLSELLFVWPSQNLNARAVQGLDILEAIGTPALPYLLALGSQSTSKTLRKKALEKVGQLAKTNGLSKDHLTTVIPPILGADAREMMAGLEG